METWPITGLPTEDKFDNHVTMSSNSDLEFEAQDLIAKIRIKHSTVVHEELAVIVNDLLHL